MPGFLGTEQQFNEKYGKPIQFSRDAKATTKDQERGALALEALHKQVLPFLMRRMKEDVLKDLPPKIIQDYYCELSPVQKLLYDDISVEGEKQHIFQTLNYLRNLCNHPSFVLSEQHPKYEQVNELMREQDTKISDIQHSPKLLALE